mgnify:CR=1 FL=1
MKRCSCFHLGTTVTVSETAVVITFADNPTGIADTQHFCFRLCQSIPATGQDLPVQVTVNGVAVPLWNRFGNPVIGSDLKTRVNYKGFYGVSTPHVISSSLPLPIQRCSCSL